MISDTGVATGINFVSSGITKSVLAVVFFNCSQCFPSHLFGFQILLERKLYPSLSILKLKPFSKENKSYVKDFSQRGAEEHEDVLFQFRIALNWTLQYKKVFKLETSQWPDSSIFPNRKHILTGDFAVLPSPTVSPKRLLPLPLYFFFNSAFSMKEHFWEIAQLFPLSPPFFNGIYSVWIT